MPRQTPEIILAVAGLGNTILRRTARSLPGIGSSRLSRLSKVLRGRALSYVQRKHCLSLAAPSGGFSNCAWCLRCATCPHTQPRSPISSPVRVSRPAGMGRIKRYLVEVAPVPFVDYRSHRLRRGDVSGQKRAPPKRRTPILFQLPHSAALNGPAGTAPSLSCRHSSCCCANLAGYSRLGIGSPYVTRRGPNDRRKPIRTNIVTALFDRTVHMVHGKARRPSLFLCGVRHAQIDGHASLEKKLHPTAKTSPVRLLPMTDASWRRAAA